MKNLESYNRKTGEVSDLENYEVELIEMLENFQAPSYEFVEKYLLPLGDFFMTNRGSDAALCQTTVITWTEDGGESYNEAYLNVCFDMIEDVEELDDDRLYVESNGFDSYWS